MHVHSRVTDSRDNELRDNESRDNELRPTELRDRHSRARAELPIAMHRPPRQAGSHALEKRNVRDSARGHDSTMRGRSSAEAGSEAANARNSWMKSHKSSPMY
jgi:hypothetical protein